MTQPTFRYETGERTYPDTENVPADLRGRTVQTFDIYVGAHRVATGTGSEADAKAALDAEIAARTMASVPFADGSSRMMQQRVADTVLGLSDERYLVVSTEWGGAIALTPCCQASGKGEIESETGVVCRGCFIDVDYIHGDSHVPVTVPVATTAEVRA